MWHTATNSCLEQIELPGTTAPDELIVESEYSLISLGSERLVINGGVPAELFNTMRIPYMLGDFDDKFTYGYSLVGRVVDGPAEQMDKRVHLLHPHQHFARVACNDVYFLPDTLDSLTAVLISNMETAVNAVWDSGVGIGDRVLVVGSGTIGILLAKILSGIAGVQVQLAETHTARRQAAQTLFGDQGSSVSVITGAGMEAGAVAEAGASASTSTSCGSFDIAFNTGKNSDSLQFAINAVAFEGLVVDVAWHGSESVSLDLGGSFHAQRKRLIASQVSQIPASKSRAWTFQSRKDLVVRLLQELDCSGIITEQVVFNRAAHFFNALRLSMPEASGIVLDYQEP